MRPSERVANAAPRCSLRSRRFVHGLPALAVLVAALSSGACENPVAPVSCGSVPQRMVLPVGASEHVRLCFNDENGDRVSLSASSSDWGVLTVSTVGGAVTVTGEGGGTATVTVTARDPGGLSRTVSFTVWVPRVERLADGWFPAWSPDGTRITFSSGRYGGDRAQGDIFVIDADGSGETRLTHSRLTDDRFPVWSPDGSRIAFLSESHIPNVINVDGSGATTWTNHPAYSYGPVWSPDGSRIAFVSRHDGDLEIYVMNADGSAVTNLTNAPGSDWSLAWAPDGSRIAFESRRDGDFEIYVMNPDGSGATNLTNDAAIEQLPAWSPDGSRIAFESNRDGGREIYVMNADGSGATRLTKGGARDFHRNPVWSPDGSRIAFIRGYGNDWTLSVMNADGSGAADLALDSYGPVWSPDGRKIAFTCEYAVCLVDLSEGLHR